GPPGSCERRVSIGKELSPRCVLSPSVRGRAVESSPVKGPWWHLPQSRFRRNVIATVRRSSAGNCEKCLPFSASSRSSDSDRDTGRGADVPVCCVTFSPCSSLLARSQGLSSLTSTGVSLASGSRDGDGALRL